MRLILIRMAEKEFLVTLLIMMMKMMKGQQLQLKKRQRNFSFKSNSDKPIMGWTLKNLISILTRMEEIIALLKYNQTARGSKNLLWGKEPSNKKRNSNSKNRNHWKKTGADLMILQVWCPRPEKAWADHRLPKWRWREGNLTLILPGVLLIALGTPKKRVIKRMILIRVIENATRVPME